MPRPARPMGALGRAVSLALCVVVLVQFASVSVLHNTASTAARPHERIPLGGPAAPLPDSVPAGMVPKVGHPQKARAAREARARSSGMDQTEQWLNVVSGSPHWLEPKAGSDALLDSIERDAASKFGMPIPAAPPPATPPAAGAADGGRAFNSNAVAGLHTFYYAWYGTPALDGKWVHWNHEVLKHWGGPAVNSKYPTIGHKHVPPAKIGSNFYPSLGPYSSRNASVIDAHVTMMAQAGIGVLVYSWWGRGLADANGDPTDETIIALVGEACVRHHVKFTFHLEPYEGRSALSVKEDVKHLVSKYGKHPALYLLRGKPVFYVYDSYRTSKEEWRHVLGPRSVINPKSIRGTDHDCIVLGLWVESFHGEDLKTGGFDGFYTYFATDGMTYGSSHRNWPSLQAFASRNNMLFVPSIGPGYIDTAIRPWNNDNTRSRVQGEYYAGSWRTALAMAPDVVSITSFNEWHEGTQIEPASPHGSYSDYGLQGERYYLDATRKQVDACRKSSAGLAGKWCLQTT